jgi:hypothetical protein
MKKKNNKSGNNRMDRYPPDLRGPAQNGHGGYQVLWERGLRGNTYGAANAGRNFSDEERRAWAVEHGYQAK